MSEEKTPFTLELVEGVITSTVVWLYLRTLAIPLIIVILLWLIFLRRRVATVAGAILIALVTAPPMLKRPFEYFLVIALMGVGIVVELTRQIGLPVIQGQSLKYTGILDTTFFYVVGGIVSHIIQISLCSVSVIENGAFDLIRIQSQVLDCQYQFASNSLSNPNDIALCCIRWFFTSAVFWGCFILSLRRINFDPRNSAHLPGILFRALLGAGVAVIIMATINTIKISASEQYDFSPTLLSVYAYMYTVATIILTSFGSSIATRRLE